MNILVTRPVARTSSVYNLLVTDSTIRQYSVFNGPSISGMIDESGDYVRVNDVHFGQFGCALPDCLNELVGSEGASPIVEINWGFGGFEMNSMTPVSGTVRVLFASTEVVRNSFQLTRATPVPFGIPDYLPIGFFCAVVGIDRLKKWKNKKKESAKKDEQLKEEI